MQSESGGKDSEVGSSCGKLCAAAARNRVRLETSLRASMRLPRQIFERGAAGELVADGGGDFFVAGAEERVAQIIARFREIADGVLLGHRGATEGGELREDVLRGSGCSDCC